MVSHDDLIHTHIRNFAFRELFNELGWDNFGRVNEWGITNVLTYEVDGTVYTLTPVAQKRGFQVYECSPTTNGGIPPHATRQKIDRKLIAIAREHLLIFLDRDRKTQHWQWTQREKGQPAVPRGQTYYAGQAPDLLAQKLSRLAIALAEEEHIGILDVNTRARQAYEAREVTKTKRFYKQFHDQHTEFVNTFIKGITVQGDREWYASLMLNRLMFVYFIQSKKFLDGDEDYLQNRLERMQREHGKDQFYSFYRTFLLHLFHDGLATPERERTAEIDALIGTIPYLNGGLFELHEIERTYPAIEIPDAAFESLFRFFREWDWHLDTRENRTGREINPDVLGYIFEKFINQKQMGAYYTKEDITGYISRNTIIPFLFDAAKRDCENAFRPGGEVWRLLAENPDHYIYKAVRHGVDVPLPEEIAAGIGDVARRGGWNKAAPEEYALPTETWREHVARRQRCEALRAKLRSGAVTAVNDLITDNLDIHAFAQDVLIFCEGANLLEAFYDAIAGMSGRPGITVLDPTCGSGAFLFAALNVLFPLYDACLEEMRQFVEEANRLGHAERYPKFRAVLAEMDTHPTQDYFITKKIITNNLYGVDIMEEAVETCKLRLFLQLASLLEPGQRIEPLPDIDFNVRAGNTLIGYTSEAAVRQAVAARLNIFGDADRIVHQAAVVDTLLTQFRDGQTTGGPQNEVVGMQKAALRGELHALAGELDRYLAAEYGIVEEDEPEGYAASFAKWHESHQPFHWYSEFYGIMQRGGFDVIIGNPPYLEKAKLDGKYIPLGLQTISCRDIYAWVVERTLSIRSKRTRMGMIVPVSIASSDSFSVLRESIFDSTSGFWLSHFANRPGQLFEGAQNRLTIMLSVSGVEQDFLFSTRYHRWDAKNGERESLFTGLEFALASGAACHFGELIPKIGILTALTVLSKIRSGKTLDRFMVKSSRYPVFWVRVPGYFCQFFLQPPKARPENGGDERQQGEVNAAYLQSEEQQQATHALLNSSTFYQFFCDLTDGRHINPSDVQKFPAGLGNLSPSITASLLHLSTKLDEDMKRNTSIVRKSGLLKDSVDSRKMKPVIDKIDRELARHYDFTDEELDFIINYDIKYRMEQGAAEDGE